MLDPDAYDWTRFSLTFYYDAPLATVFASWASGAGLESFFVERVEFRGADGARSSTDLCQSGDAYHWTWRQPFEVRGTVLECQPHESLAFTFGAMRVDVAFQQFESQTEVVLLQSDIPATADGRVAGHLNCRSCWIFFMTNLQSLFRAGIDLRDVRADRVASMEVGFQPLTSRN